MLYLLIVLCSLFIIWRLWFKKPSLEPPLLSGWLPIVGHGYKAMGNAKRISIFFKQMVEECREKGGAVKFHLGSRKIYGLTDPDDCLTVMNICMEKHFYGAFLKPLLGNGLLIADGLRALSSTTSSLTNRRVSGQTWTYSDKKKYISKTNSKNAKSTTLGFYGNDPEYRELFVEYIFKLSRVLESFYERIQKFWLNSDFIYNFTARKKRVEEDIKRLSALSQSIIRTKKLEKERKKNILTEEFKSGHFKPFMDLILDLAAETGCFTDDQVRYETESVIFAGHETQSTTLTFALVRLGSHIDVQEKAYQEICHVIGSSNTVVDKENLNKLVYIEAILKETLRLHGILKVLARRINKDVKLKKHTLKANSDCFIFLDAFHQHSIWGPDAAQFRPERWLDKETLPDPKYYGAFGLGRRSCIGKTYAMMAMKIVVMNVVRKFHISSDISKLAIKVDVVVRPLSGHYITLSPRNTGTLII